jgi:DNA-binding GntR family transcriptional regulator
VSRTQQVKIKSEGAAALVFQPLIDKTQPPVEQAYQYVLQSIMSGELTPGMRIPAEAVAEALGVSRMPVRDALRRLEGDGAITIFANRGASVAQFSREEVVELIEMRAVLEGHAARAALPKLGADDLEELDQLKLRMERASSDLSKWMLRHDEFHNYLSGLSRRGLLIRQTERMRIMLRPYYRQYYAKTGELEIAGLEHRKIIDAIRKGDEEHVEQIVRSHALKNVKKIAALAA